SVFWAIICQPSSSGVLVYSAGDRLGNSLHRRAAQIGNFQAESSRLLADALLARCAGGSCGAQSALADDDLQLPQELLSSVEGGATEGIRVRIVRCADRTGIGRCGTATGVSHECRASMSNSNYLYS